MCIFTVREHKQSKRFNKQWCIFNWINKTELSLIVYSYVGNKHCTIQKPKMCTCVFEYDASIEY